MTFEKALRLIEILVGLSCIIQTLEMIQSRRLYNDKGIWRLHDLMRDFEGYPVITQKVFKFFFSYSSVLILQCLGLLSAIAMIFAPHPVWTLLLLFNSLVIAARWRGSYNGGSDYMTVLVLTTVAMTQTAGLESKIALGAFWYLSIQTVLSYFIAGWVKIKNPEWRKGQALSDILIYSHYAIPNSVKKRAEKPSLMFLATWFILLFELSFPLIFLGSYWLWFYLGLALVFHLFNAWALGLNRFTLAWLASYPALVFCVLRF